MALSSEGVVHSVSKSFIHQRRHCEVEMKHVEQDGPYLLHVTCNSDSPNQKAENALTYRLSSRFDLKRKHLNLMSLPRDTHKTTGYTKAKKNDRPCGTFVSYYFLQFCIKLKQLQ